MRCSRLADLAAAKGYTLSARKGFSLILAHRNHQTRFRVHLRLTALLVLIAHTSIAQEEPSAPLQSQRTFWTPALRLGIGRQPAFYPEIGVGIHRNTLNEGLKNSGCIYLSLEQSIVYFTDAGRPVYGLKAGYEQGWRGALLGLEAKRQAGAGQVDYVFTPRLGVSLRGIASFAYGYNLSLNNYPFPRHGRHQLSLTANLYRRGFGSQRTARAPRR